MIDHFLYPHPQQFFKRVSSNLFISQVSFCLLWQEWSISDGLCNRMLWTQTLNILADCFHKFFLFLFSFLHWIFLLLEIILHWFSLYILRTREVFWSRQVYINPGSVLDRFYSTILSLSLVAVSVGHLYLIQNYRLPCTSQHCYFFFPLFSRKTSLLPASVLVWIWIVWTWWKQIKWPRHEGDVLPWI